MNEFENELYVLNPRADAGTTLQQQETIGEEQGKEKAKAVVTEEQTETENETAEKKDAAFADDDEQLPAVKENAKAAVTEHRSEQQRKNETEEKSGAAATDDNEEEDNLAHLSQEKRDEMIAEMEMYVEREHDGGLSKKAVLQVSKKFEEDITIVEKLWRSQHAGSLAAPIKSWRRPDLTSEERDDIVTELLLHATRNEKTGKIKLKKGTHESVRKKFGISRSTLERIWQRAKASYGSTKRFTAPSQKCNTGRKRTYNLEEVKEKISRLPVSKRRLKDIVDHIDGMSYCKIHYIARRHPEIQALVNIESYRKNKKLKLSKAEEATATVSRMSEVEDTTTTPQQQQIPEIVADGQQNEFMELERLRDIRKSTSAELAHLLSQVAKARMRLENVDASIERLENKGVGL